MIPALAKITQHVATLQAFAEHFKLGELDPERDYNIHLPEVNPNSREELPTVSIIAARQWALDTFGPAGWQTNYQSDGWQHVQRNAMGVRVCLYQAFRVVGRTNEPKTIDPVMFAEPIASMN